MIRYEEQKKQCVLRYEAAKLLHQAAEAVKLIETQGWDVPAEYIAGELAKWARQYGFRESRS